jgi:hypothetical protein
MKILLALIMSFPILFEGTAKRQQSNVYEYRAKCCSSEHRFGIIVTRRCTESAFDERVIVRFDPHSGENRMLFVRTGKTCDVVTLSWQENR